MLRRNNRLIPALFVFAFLLIASRAPAQNKPDSIRVKMREIIVNRTYSNISSVDAPLALSLSSRSNSEVSSTAASSLSSITRQLPGVWVSNRHTDALGGRVLIRGIGWRATYGVRGVQVVLNNIPLTMADGSSVINIIDPDVIKDMEVIRGPSSTYWGNSAGGTLYLSSHPDYSGNRNFRLRMYGGSYGLAKGIIQYHRQFGRHKISAYSSYQSKNGYRDYSASRLFRAGLTGSYKISDKSRVEYSGAFFSMPKAENPSALTARQTAENSRQANAAYVQSGSGKQARQGQLGLNYYRDTSFGRLTLTGYGIFRNLTNPLPFAIIHIDRLASGFRGTLQKSFNHFHLKGGIELKIQHDDRHEYENNGGRRGAITVNQIEKVRNKSVFLNAAYQWNEFKFKGAIRYDWLTFETDAQHIETAGQRTFHAVSPGFGISFHPGSAVIYSNLSTSFQAPTTTELTNRPGGGNGFNPNLKPEQTLGIEVGSRWNMINNLWTFDVALYRMWIHHMIFPYQLRPNGAQFYRNEGKARHSGIEFKTVISPTSNLQLQATYNFIYATFHKAQTLEGMSLKGKQVPGIPRHRLGMSLTWSAGAFWIQLNNQFVSSYAVNTVNSTFTDSYWTVGAKISYNYTFQHSGVKITPFINLNNMFDAAYIGVVTPGARGGKYYYPAPGRNWQAGVSFSF